MHGIYEIEKMLCDELDELGQKGELTTGSLETVDKLAHALKNTQKVIEYYETMGDYSNRGGYDMYDGSYARDSRRGGRTGANQYGSYVRGGRRGGGYSRAEGTEMVVTELHKLMNDAPDHKIKQKMQELITEIEGM